jgi:cytochrome c oxidase subunit II
MTLSTLLSLIAEPKLPKFPESPLFWFPRDVSVTSRHVDHVWNFMIWMSVICALGIFVVMFYFVHKYRAKSRAANEVPEPVSEHNTTLEITWSVIPLIVCIMLFVWGFKGYVDLRTPPKDALEIHATAQKWKWTFENTCPDGSLLPDENLHAPVNTDVRVIIQAVDVLHALYLPNFRQKMDAVPGRYTDLWFNVREAGTYPVFCAEYCGTHHSDMLSNVIIHQPGEYEKWLQKACDDANKLSGAALGEKIYNTRGCSTCHSIDGTPKIGPTWKGMFGRTENITGGAPIKVDENYIAESIRDPQAKVVQGFGPVMPLTPLKDKEVEGVIAFIKTLK